MRFLPHLSVTLIVVILVFYVVGARWPMLAQRFGLA